MQHRGNLLFGGVAVAGDGLFHFFGKVLKNRNFLAQCSSNGGPLGASEFKQRLHIERVERSLDGQFIGFEFADEFKGFLKNLT